jgi:Uma2 family endonuclease
MEKQRLYLTRIWVPELWIFLRKPGSYTNIRLLDRGPFSSSNSPQVSR